MKLWTQLGIHQFQATCPYLGGLHSSRALKMPTERPNQNSGCKKQSYFKSGMSRNKIIYMAKKAALVSIFMSYPFYGGSIVPIFDK